MKYALQKSGSGPYVYKGAQVIVAKFSTSAAMREWIAEALGREEIGVKQYVQDLNNCNVSVRAAAISPDEIGDCSRVMVPHEMEAENGGRFQN